MAVEEDRGNSEVIAFVVRRVTCPHCDEAYVADNVRVVLYDGDQRILQATCAACGAEQHIVAYDTPPYFQLQVAPVATLSAITEDEVSAWGQFLASFDGDIEDLFLAD